MTEYFGFRFILNCLITSIIMVNEHPTINSESSGSVNQGNDSVNHSVEQGNIGNNLHNSPSISNTKPSVQVTTYHATKIRC